MAFNSINSWEVRDPDGMVRPPTGGFCAQMASEPTREELVQRIRGLIAGWRVEANDNMNDMRAQCAFDDCADALERLL